MTEFYNLLAIINIIVCIILIIVAILRVRSLKDNARKRINIAYAIISAYWTSFYVYTLAGSWGLYDSSSPLHGILIRPAITATVALICIDLINRHKRGYK